MYSFLAKCNLVVEILANDPDLIVSQQIPSEYYSLTVTPIYYAAACRGRFGFVVKSSKDPFRNEDFRNED